MRNTTKKATVRLSDIAKETGYSLSTVSKALNGRADVSEETWQTINAVLKRYGYSRKATGAKSQRIIEIVFQDFDNVWALEVLRGTIREAKLHDLNVITTEGGNRQHPDSSWIDNMLRRQTDGAILVFSSLTRIERNKLHSRGIPFVLFDPFGNPDPDTLSVQADNWTGGVIATRHLLALGHTRIGIITGPEEMMCSKARLDGYTSALAEHGIEADPELITEGDFTTSGGYAQSISLLKRPNRPTAIFAGSDLQAMGVYEAARQLGLRIPEDLSVVGFDDVQTAAFLGPALTTVRQPLQDMARAAVRMLVEALSTGDVIQPHIIMPTSLVVCNSTQQLED
ncbi:LacI family transcriptional regulator [Bifidobacterium pseudocatenulatum]|uniref:LacI family DNA-binding transcriptional regulator n=1 Tax=Bifidobacterium pseudocatenulatum TaxID=28026 RepID=UPI000E4164CA|nr:LacI family DNA-binding transcriptional regulator [Bifidobacterium pseudocatenulatum]RGJ16428.1 LacI family transcriptional regulator [Bifidobacterium pseudocatenulatum]